MDDQTLLARVTALSAELGGELSRRIARLAELEAEFLSAVETAKLDALKEFAYGASHEINNPLANISARAQTLLQDERDPERRRRLAAINSQAFRAHEMIADVMLFARPPRMERREVDLAAFIDAVVDEMSQSAAAQGTQLAHRADAPQLASVDPVHFRVALSAIVTNSLEALGEGGRIEIALRRPPSAARDSSEKRASPETKVVQIIISDTGPGISPAIRPHIFDPFFSGREAGRGLGMGLPKSWRIIREHGGWIDVKSPASGGATFTISLPLETPRSQRNS